MFTAHSVAPEAQTVGKHKKRSEPRRGDHVFIKGLGYKRCAAIKKLPFDIAWTHGRPSGAQVFLYAFPQFAPPALHCGL